jgi:hypothetical protein
MHSKRVEGQLHPAQMADPDSWQDMGDVVDDWMGEPAGVLCEVDDNLWALDAHANLASFGGGPYPGLVKDGVEFMLVVVVRMARSTVVQVAVVDLARTWCGGATLTRATSWCQRSRWAWGKLSPLISGTMHSNRL